MHKACHGCNGNDLPMLGIQRDARRKEKTHPVGAFFVLAEAVRFELTEGSHLRRFSRPVHSTTLPRFQLNSANIVMCLLPAFASGLRQK
jgi:hypothetical protein